jgi:heptaprenyl diphosphate synthase
VAGDLQAVEAALRSEIAGDPPEVSAPMADLFAAGGKRLRPALVLLSAKLGRYQVESVVPAAMAVELTHAATLVHDDVIDRAPTRRGRPTVAAALGNEPAIVIGDFYFAKSYELAARTKDPEVVGLLARAVMEICAGEVRQQGVRFRYAPDVDEYMQRIHAKTATLLTACCDIGAVLGELDARVRHALHTYGTLTGLAFQIADDVLDYTGSEDEIGKPIGHDLAEGFATLPLMLALESGAMPDRLRALLVEGRGLGTADANRVAEVVRESGAPTVALERARALASQARDQLRGLADGEALTALSSLTEYVVSRTF